MYSAIIRFLYSLFDHPRMVIRCHILLCVFCRLKIHLLCLYLVSILIKRQYKCALARIRCLRQKRKLRVLFIIGDPSKWKCQSVYDAMSISLDFEPYVVPTIMDAGFYSDSDQPNHYARCKAFFLEKGLHVLDGVDAMGKMVPLRILNPDLVIYQQPYGVGFCQSPVSVCDMALTFYVPYYVIATGTDYGQHDAPIFKTLYGNFIETQEWIDYYRRNDSFLNADAKMFACPSPFLDEIRLAGNGVQQENAVIYAPHWAFPHSGNHTSPGTSTFLETGRCMLEFARNHPDIHWIFKPHPALRERLVSSGVWSRQEVDSYYAAWESIGEGYYTGDYLQIFYRSRALITDCGSFLSEYLYLDRPIIRIENEAANRFPKAAAKKFDAFYRVSEIADLNDVLNRVVVQCDDYKRVDRMHVIEDVCKRGESAASCMLGIFRTLLDCENDGK